MKMKILLMMREESMLANRVEDIQTLLLKITYLMEDLCHQDLSIKDVSGAPMSPFGGERRSYMQRTFGPMK